MKRYLPKKPKKLGLKLWAMAGVSGYIYNFEVDGEKGKTGPPQRCTAPDSVGASGAVVLRMSMNLQRMMHKLFFDNLFCSPELVIYLHSKGIWAIGTLNIQRSRKCLIPSEKDLKKKGGCGAIAEIKSSYKPLVVTSWYNKKRVTLISNFVGKNNVAHCTRFDRK